MPLINRIEIRSFMNHRREDPWRPDWRHQMFTLKGFHTAMNIPNGRGKSSIVLLILAMLEWHSKSLRDLQARHFAPVRFGHYTHLRIEITQTNARQEDLLTAAGGDPVGDRVVFGLYGNAGENERVRFYSYRGSLEDCPIANAHSGRIDLVKDDDFLERLRKQPSLFPSSVKEERRDDWRKYVSDFFDVASIRQQLQYQLARGAEGSSTYFEVAPPKGMTYGAALFYERLAPELLSHVMGGLGEDDERGIEDTIVEKAQSVLRARRKTAQTAAELDQAERVLNEFQRLKQFAGETESAREKLNKHRRQISIEIGVLRNVLVDDPLPGVPARPAPEHPEFYSHFAVQEQVWYLADKGLSLLVGDEPKRVNERADRSSIATAQLRKSQAIDLACDHGSAYANRKQGGGRPSRGYTREAAQQLIQASSQFADGWAKEEALEALQRGFDWAENIADTNIARRRSLEAARRLELANEGLTQLNRERNDRVQRRSFLQTEQTGLTTGQALWSGMQASGLFSAGELAFPEKTGQAAERAMETAQAALNQHISRVSASRPLHDEYLRFKAEHAKGVRPADIADGMEQQASRAKAIQVAGFTRLAKERMRAASYTAAEKKTLTVAEGLSNVIARLEELSHLLASFDAIFPGETAQALENKVRGELQTKQRELNDQEIQLAHLEAPNQAAESFARQFPGTEPKTWLNERDAKRQASIKKRDEFEGQLKDSERRRRALDTDPVAAGHIAQAVVNAAGGEHVPLHRAIDAMQLDSPRRERVLSLFSALLFSPVYDSGNAEQVTAKRESTCQTRRKREANRNFIGPEVVWRPGNGKFPRLLLMPGAPVPSEVVPTCRH